MSTITNATQSFIGSFLSGSPYGSFALRQLVASAHRRSEEHGLSPRDKCFSDAIATPKQLRDANEALLLAAEPVMQYLSTLLKKKQSDALLLLSNSEATIVAVAGGASFDLPFEARDIKIGVNWSESFKGTNALGTAIKARRAVLVNQGEHYLERLKDFSCASVLIRDATDKVLGAMCLTRPAALSVLHDELILLSFAANRISHRYFLADNHEHYVFAIHGSKKYLDTPSQGLIAIDKNGEVRAIDKTALQHLKNIGLNSPSNEVLFGQLSRSFLLKYKSIGSAFIKGCEIHYQLIHWPLPILGHYKSLENKQEAHSQLASQCEKVERSIQRLYRGFAKKLPLLLFGEAGSGKKTLAKDIHNSVIGHAPFIRVNCSTSTVTALERELLGCANSKGAILQAQGGTLYLEAAEHFPSCLQSKLLSILHMKEYLGEPVNLRLIVATSKKPSELYESQRWEADFYTETATLCFEVPPLRERNDVLKIVSDFLQQQERSALSLSQELQDLFSNAFWPGNIRQLRMVLRTLVATLPEEVSTIGFEHLPENLIESLCSKPKNEEAGLNLRRNEKALMEEAIERNNGNMSAAARELGISRATLYRRLKQ